MKVHNSFVNFNFHGLATMQVEASSPTADLLHDIFFPFLTDQPVDYPDIVVSGSMQPITAPSFGETEYEYTENSLFIHDTDVQILKEENRYYVNGTRELLVSVLPILDRVMVTHGAAMIHAATIEYRGQAINLPAWGGTGKTSTIAKLLRRDGYAFMGDDWGWLTQDGRLLAFAKPMFIKPHHKPIYPHLFDGARKPLVPVRFSRPLGKLTTRVHPVITKYPRLARATRKFSPEHKMVRPEAAFPEARFSNAAPLVLSVFVERFGGNEVELSEKDRDWMVSRMVGNFHAEITQHSQQVIAALSASSLLPIETYFGEKAAVLEQALGDTPNFLLRVPQSFSPDQASDAIVAELESVMERVGVKERGVTENRVDSVVQPTVHQAVGARRLTSAL
jgi:hypothetical protein